MTLQKKFYACDPGTINEFLNDHLEEDERSSFVSHLEDCSTCQQAMNEAAASSEFWQEVTELLKRDEPGSYSNVVTDGDSNVTTSHIIDLLSPTDDPEMLGKIGEYEISGVVGIGGMGAVLKGFDRSLMRVVAIKIMSPHLANHGSARVRFEREARAAAAICHNNVIDIYRVDEINGLPYLVMPFARGASLQSRVEGCGPLTTTEVVHVGRQIASGLAAAHEQGLVHRDIKPANILLNDGIERLLITDFGVARAMDDASMTQTGLIAGTPQYMSPEQARGEIVDQRSDLFSLGAVLYTACTGRPPFRAETPFAVLRKITDAPPRPLRELNPEIPDWLANLIHGLLEKNPDARMSDAASVAKIFEKCQAHLRQPNQIDLPSYVQNLRTLEVAKPKTSSTKRWLGWRQSILLAAAAMLGGLLMVAYFKFQEAPDISGSWQGEIWQNITLSSVSEASGWYSGNFVDAKQRKGALHLEWSPLSRRYDGTWSLGGEKTGTIVLRSGREGSVRGAISIDPNVQTSSAEMRLRDFVWKHGATKLNFENVPKQNSLARFDARPIYAPNQGVITKVIAGMGVGKKVRKGDVLLQIQGENRELVIDQLNDLRSIVEAAQAKSEAYAKNADAFLGAREFSIKAAEEMAESVRANWGAKTNLLKAHQAKVKQSALNLERTKKLHEKSFVTEKELQNGAKELDIAKADLSAAQHEVEKLFREWKAKKAEVSEKGLLAQAKIDHATAMQQDALQQVASAKKEIRELENKLADARLTSVLAPVDGTITKWNNLVPGSIVDFGLELCQISPVDAVVSNIENAGNAASETSRKLDFDSMTDLIRYAADIEQRLVDEYSITEEVNRDLSELSKKLGDAATRIQGRGDDLESSNSQQELKSVEELQAKIEELNRTRIKNGRTVQTIESELSATIEMIELNLARTTRNLDLQKAKYEHGDSTIDKVNDLEDTRERQLKQLELLTKVKDRYSEIKKSTVN